jgi:hypothetical protein
MERLVCSDVCATSSGGDTDAVFVFSLTTPVSLWACVDADGDFDIDQTHSHEGDAMAMPVCRANVPCHTLRLVHQTSSSVADVGLQIWRGSCILADWLIHLSRAARNSLNTDQVGHHPAFGSRAEQTLWQNGGMVFLEVGAGTGLVALVAGALSDTTASVFLTDHAEAVLARARINVNTAMDVVAHRVRVLPLDLTHPHPLAAWSASDRAVLDTSASVLLGADVVYDDELSVCLVHFLLDFLTPRGSATPGASECTSPASPPFRMALFTIECRHVFTLRHMAPVAPAVECFLAELRAHTALQV